MMSHESQEWLDRQQAARQLRAADRRNPAEARLALCMARLAAVEGAVDILRERLDCLTGVSRQEPFRSGDGG